VELAKENAWMVLSKDRERIKREEGRTIGAVKEIEDWLGLKDIVRMEAYDISNISGFESVGSMVVYERASRSAAIIENSRSNGCRDLTITPAWKRCLQGVLPMNPRANTTAFPFFRI
jgi:Nuclease subunit of the excinuclease complex